MSVWYSRKGVGGLLSTSSYAVEEAAVGRFGMSVVGALDVAVGGCRESETDVVDMLVVGVVRICAGDVGGIVRWLAEELECADLKSVGRLARSVLGGSVGVVGGCRRLESSVMFILNVGEVRTDVGGLVGVGVLV